MNVGDLVKPLPPYVEAVDCASWVGVIIGWAGTEPVVFWNEKFPFEIEYKEQIEVISETN